MDFVKPAIRGSFHEINLSNRYDYYFARMVSGGTPPGALTTPSADFAVNADGTVTHVKT